MKNRQSACTERYRREGLGELVAELEEFSYDGLVLLRDDLRAGRVIRGSWAGCVLSYKRGAAGSTRRDRLGRARNALTVLWDSGWFTDEEVLAAVSRELARRRVQRPVDDGADSQAPDRAGVADTRPRARQEVVARPDPRSARPDPREATALLT